MYFIIKVYALLGQAIARNSSGLYNMNGFGRGWVPPRKLVPEGITQQLAMYMRSNTLL